MVGAVHASCQMVHLGLLYLELAAGRVLARVANQFQRFLFLLQSRKGFCHRMLCDVSMGLILLAKRAQWISHSFSE